MSKMMRGFLLLGFLCFFSCSGFRRDSGTQYSSRLRLPIGNRWYYTLSSELHTTAEIGDQKHESGRKTEVGLVYEVLRADRDTIALKVTYDKLHITMHNDGQDKEITGKPGGNADDPLETLFGSLLGNSITVYLNPRGEVLGVVGYDTIGQKILASTGVTNEAVRNKIRTQLDKFVGAEFINAIFQQEFRLFPDSAVRIRGSWSRQTKPSEEFKIGMNTTFSLESIDGPLARVDIRSDLVNKTGDTVNLLGSQATADLDGNERGRFEVDTATGMLVSGETRLSLEGKVEVMGRDVPVKIISERKAEGKRIR